MDEDRIKHSIMVARKMVEISNNMNITQEEKEACFVIELNHDIGYEYGDNTNHSKIGGLLLKKMRFKYWKEIYYHGIPNSSYKSNLLLIINQADMQIDKFGNDVGYQKRLNDIENRYGKESKVYSDCRKLIEELVILDK